MKQLIASLFRWKSGVVLGVKRNGAGVVFLLVPISLAACTPATTPLVSDLPPVGTIDEVGLSMTASVRVTPRATRGDGTTVRVVPLPDQVNLRVGATVVLDAVALDIRDEPVSNAQFLWSIAVPQAGRIDHRGVFTAGSEPGFYPRGIQVEIRPEGEPAVIAFVAVQVSRDSILISIDHIQVIPETLVLRPGQTARITAIGVGRDGRFIPEMRFAWSSDEEVGTISALGQLTVTTTIGTFPNAVQVIGSAFGESMSKLIDVEVSAAADPSQLAVVVVPARLTVERGGSFQFRAVATVGGFDSPQRASSAVWTISDERVGTMSVEGRFRAGEVPGTYPNAVNVEVIASVAGRLQRSSSSATVTIVDNPKTIPAVQIAIQPGTIVVEPGEVTLVRAIGIDNAGLLVAGMELEWSLADSDAGTISRIGLLTASLQPGVYRRAVRVDGHQRDVEVGAVVSAYADLRVIGRLAEMVLSPKVVTLVEGDHVRFEASALDEFGTPMTRLMLRWEVLDDRAGSIDSLGFFSAGSTPGWYPDAIRLTVVETPFR